VDKALSSLVGGACGRRSRMVLADPVVPIRPSVM
jgi:hypothetical protein